MVASCSHVLRQEDSQHQQHIAHGFPLDEFVPALIGVDGLLNLADALPDPHCRASSTTEEVGGNVEQCPAAVCQQVPAPLAVGNRLSVGEFDQRLTMGFIQRRQNIAAQGAFARSIGPARSRWISGSNASCETIHGDGVSLENTYWAYSKPRDSVGSQASTDSLNSPG